MGVIVTLHDLGLAGRFCDRIVMLAASGSDLLDEAARETIARWRFRPAETGGGGRSLRVISLPPAGPGRGRGHRNAHRCFSADLRRSAMRYREVLKCQGIDFYRSESRSLPRLAGSSGSFRG